MGAGGWERRALGVDRTEYLGYVLTEAGRAEQQGEA